ncbi:MAG: DUF932 domain-containing protein [Thermodesulfobacteriota bacterium]|nr:DUF932 domain-containing protein [Thermodesulfobacteriota bacterium]
MEEVTFPNIVEEPVMWGYHKELHQAHKHKAIVDFNTGKLFSIVSKDYKLIRHEEAIEEIEDLIYDNEDLGKPTIKTSFYNDGGRMCRSYRFLKVPVKINPGDDLCPELHLYNSYDVTWPLIVVLGAYRLVCKNGMVVRKTLFRFKKRHVLELERMNFKEDVSTVLTRFDSQVKTLRGWRTRPISLETYDEIMNTMEFGKDATEEIESKVNEDFEGFLFRGYPQITAWLFYNILTWYATHKAVSLNHRVELENRLRRAISYF